MTPQETMGAITAFIAIIGWIELRTRTLIAASEQTTKARTDALTQQMASLDMTIRDLTKHTREIGEKLGEIKGRLEGAKD